MTPIWPIRLNQPENQPQAGEPMKAVHAFLGGTGDGVGVDEGVVQRLRLSAVACVTGHVVGFGEPLENRRRTSS